MPQTNIHEQHLGLAKQVVEALDGAHLPGSPLWWGLAGVHLVGSVARNTDTDQSDVDIVVTKNGEEESWPYPFLDAVVGTLASAQVPLRPSGLYRKKHPGTVNVLVTTERTFRNPESLRREDFANDRLWENIVRFGSNFVLMQLGSVRGDSVPVTGSTRSLAHRHQ